MSQKTMLYTVEMDIGGVAHKEEVRASNTHNAAKKLL